MSVDYLIINLLEDLVTKPRASLVLSKPSFYSIPKPHPQSQLLVKAVKTTYRHRNVGHQVKRQNLVVDTLTAPQTTGNQELQGQDSGIRSASPPVFPSPQT